MDEPYFAHKVIITQATAAELSDHRGDDNGITTAAALGEGDELLALRQTARSKGAELRGSRTASVTSRPT